MTSAALPDKTGLLLRVGLFVLLGWLGWTILPAVIVPLGGVLIGAQLSVFTAAAVANAVVVRIYERGRLADLGLGWSDASSREFFSGTAAGAIAGAVILVVPLAAGLARFVSGPVVEHRWAGLVFVILTTLLGAMGEEMLFRGYAFQLLIRSMGAFAVILPTSVIFGLMHVWNQNASLLGILNTIAWGILLGYAYWRTGALWLPIGLHFGWNVALPLFGANLSGFTMGVTGYALEWNVGVLWSGGAYGPEASLLTTIIVVALFFALRRLTPQAEETEEASE